MFAGLYDPNCMLLNHSRQDTCFDVSYILVVALSYLYDLV